MTKRGQSSRDTTDQPVHRAAAGDPEELVRLLDTEPSLRDEPGWFGRQPLHAAAQSGNASSVEILLGRGAGPDAEEGLHHDTPLIGAVESDSLACVSLLLEAGADPNKPGRRGQTSIFVARSLPVLRMLLDAGARPDVVDSNGDTPIQNCASYVGSPETLRFWIDRGADPDAEPVIGWPPLHGILGGGLPERRVGEPQRVEMLTMLLDHGASVDAKDRSSLTALHYACRSHLHLTRCVELLLERNADPNLCDHWGNTALHFAVTREYGDIVRTLLERGADPNLPNHHHSYPLDLCDGGGSSDRREELIRLLAPVTQKPERPVPTAESVLQRLRSIPKYREIAPTKCTQAEVDDLERRLGVKLPRSYRRLLMELGHGLGDFMISDHWRFRIDEAPDLYRREEYREYCDLPQNHFVFAERNGYWWTFFVVDGSDDPPVFGFDDGEERSYRFVARTVWEFIESLVIDYEHWGGERGA